MAGAVAVLFCPAIGARQSEPDHSGLIACSECAQAFATRAELIAHQESTHPEARDTAFKCACGKRFSSQCAIRAHAAAKQHYIPLKFAITRDF